MTEGDQQLRGRAPQRAALEDALVDRLSMLSVAAPALDEDVRSRQRARLVAMAAVRTPEVRPSRARRLLSRRAVDAPVTHWRGRLTAGLAGAALTVATLSGLVALAQGSGPGDLLYDVKRGTEETQVALASDSERGLTLLQFATTRLTELESLTGAEAGALAVAPSADGSDVVSAAGADADTVRAVLATMDEQTTEGTYWLTGTIVDSGDPVPLGTLDTWAEAQRDGITALEPSLPEAARPDAARSLALVDAVASRSAALQTGYACPGGLQTAGSDSLGPVPAPCAVPTDPATPTAAPSGAAGGAATATPATPTSAAPAPTAAPTAGGGAPATGGGAAGSSGAGAAATSLVPVPQVPVPQVPVPQVPGLPLPTAVPSTSGALVEVPPLVPGVQVCLPPVITVGC